MQDIVDEFLNALLTCNRLSAKTIYTSSNAQMTPEMFVDDVIVVTLEKMGLGWENGSIALSQIYMGGRICEDLVDEIIAPKNTIVKKHPNTAISVLNDHHILGKRIVYSTLRSNGFELFDYGRTDVDQLVHQIKEDKIKILLISVLMLPSALLIKDVKKKLMTAGLDVKIIVGGAPFRFDTRLWRDVGADAMCRTASEAVSAIKKVTGGIS